MWDVAVFALGALCVLLMCADPSYALSPVVALCVALLSLHTVARHAHPHVGFLYSLTAESSLMAANLVVAMQHLRCERAPWWKVAASLVFFPLGYLLHAAVRLWRHASGARRGKPLVEDRHGRVVVQLLILAQAAMIATCALAFAHAPLDGGGGPTYRTPVFGFSHRLGELHQLTVALHAMTATLVLAGGVAVVFGSALVVTAWSAADRVFLSGLSDAYSVLWMLHGFFGVIIGANRMLSHGLLPTHSGERASLERGWPPHILVLFAKVLLLVFSMAVHLTLFHVESSCFRFRAASVNFGLAALSWLGLLALAAAGLAAPPHSVLSGEYAYAAPVFLAMCCFSVFNVVNFASYWLASEELDVASRTSAVCVMATAAICTSLNLVATKTGTFPYLFVWLPWVAGFAWSCATGLRVWQLHRRMHRGVAGAPTPPRQRL